MYVSKEEEIEDIDIPVVWDEIKGLDKALAEKKKDRRVFEGDKMTETEIDLFIKEGEGYKLEFKRELANIDKAITAFANAGGGTILLGIDDDGSVHGISNANRLKAELLSTARNCDPGVVINAEKHDYKGKELLIVRVEEGKDKPYHCREGFFMRVGASSQKMNRNEIVKLVRLLNFPTFDSLPCAGFDMRKDFDREKFTNYCKKAGITGPVKNVLASLDVFNDGKMNHAGVLFFAKEPQRFFRQSEYTVVLFRNTEETDIIDRKDIRGGLFDIVDQVYKFAEFYTRVAYRFTGKLKRENVFEYSLSAVREAVINSVVHKYYLEPGHTNMLKIQPGKNPY